MPLSRWNYYSRFVVYPVAVAVLAALALLATPSTDWWHCGLQFLAGIVAWTLAEYVLHRFLVRRIPRLRQMYEAHHRDQHALIGISSLVSAPVALVALLAPLWWLGGQEFACSMTAGLLFGYLSYAAAHHLAHHRPARPGSLFYALKRRHALHHHVTRQGNFGVTSGAWDRLFGTDIKPRRGKAGARTKSRQLAAE